MSNDIADTIAEKASRPSSTSADGVSVTNRPLSELIAAKKFLDGNDCVEAISNGTGYFAGVILEPPGARGSSCD